MQAHQKMTWLALGLTVVIAFIIGYLLFFKKPTTATGPVIQETQPAESSPGKEESAPPTQDSGIIPLEIEIDESDPVVRESLQDCSSHPAWRKWLIQPDLVRSFIAIINTIAEGQSPVYTLQEFSPARKFTVKNKNGQLFIDPGSFRRYNEFVDVFLSLDAACCYRNYLKFKPVIHRAFSELGLDNTRFEDQLKQAALLLLHTPPAPPNIQVEKKVISYSFSDSSLESLLPVQKHLLRMGAGNQSRVQSQLKKIILAFGISIEE